jgi:hypothetical protein
MKKVVVTLLAAFLVVANAFANTSETVSSQEATTVVKKAKKHAKKAHAKKAHAKKAKKEAAAAKEEAPAATDAPAAPAAEGEVN